MTSKSPTASGSARSATAPTPCEEAYDGDQRRAIADTGSAGGRHRRRLGAGHGIEPRNWHAVGTSEGRDPDRLPSSELLWDDL